MSDTNHKWTVDESKLMNDRRVIDEINRHCWIESEKLGYNIGFDQAKEDWLKKFSKAWMTYHMPDAVVKEKKEPVKPAVAAAPQPQAAAAKPAAKTRTVPKKRRAKSYISRSK